MQIKEIAKEELLLAISTANYRVSDDCNYTQEEKDKILKEIDKQMKRVEKLLGYEPGSFGRW
jgi:hypothetical protein